jgi:hypothetical protein
MPPASIYRIGGISRRNALRPGYATIMSGTAERLRIIQNAYEIPAARSRAKNRCPDARLAPSGAAGRGTATASAEGKESMSGSAWEMAVVSTSVQAMAPRPQPGRPSVAETARGPGWVSASCC